MSAFLVGPVHITVMIDAGLRHAGAYGPLRWYLTDPTSNDPVELEKIRRELTRETATSVV